MDLLNKRFISKQVLRTDEMNQVSAKIDEIITYLNTQEGDSRYMVSTIVGDGTSSYLYFLQTEERAMLTASATTSVYSITTGTTHDYPEDYVAKVEIDKGSTGRYAVIASDVQVLSGQTLSLNIKGHLSTAQSRIRVTFTGTMSGASASWNGYAQLTTMSMTPADVAWNNPFVEGSSYGFGSFTITGALQKTVHINVTGNGYSKSYTDNIGTRTYPSSYYFMGMEFPSATGVYDVEIWVESGSLESKHYTYKIMCVSAADAQAARLVCVNEVGTTVANASNSYIFAFALYNGGATTASPVRTITARYENTEHELSVETLTLATGIKHTLSYYLDITTGDNAPTLTAKMTYGNEESVTLPIDNSSSYPPTAGAVFRMNAATRSNSQANKREIVNDVGSASYSATWTKMAFVDGMDGWTVDDNGRSCLAVNAGSKVDIAYAPLSSISSTMGKTIVLTYKVKNVSDYGENIITIATNPGSSRFVGIRVRPDEICLHSSNKNTEDTKQNYHTEDEEVVNASIVIAPNYRSPLRYGNFAQIYVGGAIKCEFSWDTSDSFTTDGHIILGSDTADLYVYSIEVYDNTFGFADAHVNYVASLPTKEDKAEEKERNASVINDSNEIDFEKVRDSANYFVIEMLDGKNVPNFSEWTKKDVGLSNLEMHYHEHHEWDWKVLNVETMGQGTTSMNYFRWNLRWRIDKSTNGGQKKYCYVQYGYNAEADTWGSSTLSKSVRFDGDTHPAVKRITAKKNFASSQQSHKMGTTGAYNDLRKAILGENEANGRTAVYQEPAYGFAKRKMEGSETYYYEFIGLFTIGPDKGDKPTFAYDDEDFENTLITMEGVDHDKRLTVFRYPWNNQVTFAEESLCIDMGDGTYETGWEVGNCCGLTTDGNATQNAQVLAKLVTEFKPAYEIAYKNSPFIMGLDPTQYTLESINADINAFGALRNVNDDYRPFNHYEFYFDGVYDLYFLNVATKKYEPSNINLLEDLGISASSLTGLTLAQKDARFKELRRTRFRSAMDSSNSPWNLRDCLFTHTFLTIWGATDNHAKNSYPYRFLDKFCWRQDDLDTIFDTDNQGHSTKKYSIEFKDWTDSNHSAYVFKGEDSAFWTLIEQCYPDELRAMGNSILTAMATLSPVTTGNTLDRLMGFFQSYYWDKAQDYFTKSAYNLDARYSYEEASLYFPDSYNPGVDPLEQSHGDSVEDERRWVERRLIYAMSKYHYGPFVNYTDVSLGRIAFRSQLAQAFTLKPAMDLYPVIITGDNSAYFYGDANNGRTWDGTTCTMTNVGGSNTDVYIMAADYLRSIGDLCKLAVDSTTISGITISSKRLEVLKVGDIDQSKVTSNLKTLTLSNCPALLTIDARNLANLTDSLNLVNCPRVREVYLGGTDVRAVNFAQGCKVTTFELSNSITALILNNLKFLNSVDTTACADKILTINISGCDSLNAFQVMYNVWNTAGNVLKNIRITDISVNGNDNIAEMLYRIAKGIDNAGNEREYKGVDAIGNITNAPYISGEVRFTSLMAGYYSTLTEFYKNLTVVVGEIITPSADEIGLSLSGNETETMLEDEVENRTYLVSANSEIYKQVTWTVSQLPTGVTFSSNDDSATLNFSGYQVSGQNVGETHTITIVATSKWNNGVSVARRIFLSRVAVIDIAIAIASGYDETLEIGGKSSKLNMTFNPSNTTKEQFAYYDYDTDKITISGNGNVIASTPNYTITDVVAKLSIDQSIVSNAIRFYLNDLLIINAETDTGFASLLSYIYNTLKVSASATLLYAREAAKVTNIGTYLKNVTSITNFDQFEYFISLESLNYEAMMNMTNLESIKFPPSLTSISYSCFKGCSKLSGKISCESLVTSGQAAFQDCKMVTEAYFPSLTKANTSYGFTNMFYGCTSLVKVTLGSELDTSVTNCSAMYKGCSSLTTVNPIVFTSVTNASQVFYGCTSLVSLPVGMAFPSATNVSALFSGCTSLVSVPEGFSLPNAANAESLFNSCTSLTTLPSSLDLGDCTSLASAFNDCSSLVSLPNGWNLGKVTNINHAFFNCYLLENDGVVDDLLASGTITNASYAFYNCWAFEELGYINFSNVVTVANQHIFGYCRNLREVGNINVQLVSNINGYFLDACPQLEIVGDIDASNATECSTAHFFARDDKLHTVGTITCPNATICTLAIQYGTNNIVNFGGFSGSKCNINCSTASKLTKQSALNVINKCGDNSSGSTTYTITFHANTKALLTEADIALATAKGYTIA